MSYNSQLSINISNYGTVNFYCCYNNNSTFNYLLESFINVFPERNICPCYIIQYYHPSYGAYYDVSMISTIYSYINNNGYTQYQFVFKNGWNSCQCSRIIKDNFKKTKLEIINDFDIRIKNIEVENKKQIEIISSSQKSIKDLTNTNHKHVKENENLTKKNKQLLENFENLVDKNKNFNFEIQKLKIEKSNLNNTINELKDTIQNLKQEKINLEKSKQDLEKKVSEFINKFNSIGKKNDLAQEEIKKLKLELQKQNEQKKIDNKQIEDLLAIKEKLLIKKNENEQSNKDVNFSSFYDVIIRINSIKDINKGWEVIFNEKLEKNYDMYKASKVIKIGVIGNANRGKSFLLSKISKIILPSGYSIRTEGLSIKYPEIEQYKDRKIVLLDSAGLETPVLKEEDDEKDEKENEDEEEDKNKETTEKAEEEKKNNQNKKTQKDFKEKSREKLITELFLQNFIINNSDILITVIGNLTYSEQILLNKIRTKILNQKKNKDRPNKSLFIIHNLMNFSTINQVEEYINDFLLKSATFSLEEGHKISTNTEQINGKYFYEKDSSQNIYHLIYAKDDTEAENYYNNYTLLFFENSYLSITNLKPFDVIEEIKNNFIEISKEILEKIEKPITKDSFDNSNNKLIKLNNANDITLKKCFIDELGFSNLKANGFEPTYNCYRKDKQIILRIEAPGNSKPEIIQAEDINDGMKLIRIKRVKNKDKEPQKEEDNIINKREFGNFELNIPIKIEEEYTIKNEQAKCNKIAGILNVEFLLEEKQKGVNFISKDEDEI